MKYSFTSAGTVSLSSTRQSDDGMKQRYLSDLFRILIPLMLILFTANNVFSQESVGGYVRDAQNYLRKGQFVEALKTLNIAITTDPSLPELFYMRGYAKYSLDDYIGAEQDFSKSISIFPYLPDVYLNRAEVRSQMQNYNGALEDLSVASKLDSTNADIWFTMARVKLYLKKYYACLSDCNHAIRLKLENETIWVIKGAAELGIDRFDNAIEDLRKAISLNPSNIYAYIQLGTAWTENRMNYDSALFYLNKAVEIDSNNVFAIFDRSITLLKKKDNKTALLDLNRVVRLSPYNSYAYFNRAILYNDLGDRKSAIRDFDIVIRLNPKNLISYYYRGLLKYQEKDLKGALEDMDRTLGLLPDYTDAWYTRYQIRLDLKDVAGAKKDYDKAMELARKNNMTPDSLVKKKDFLQSLVKLSGDFEVMNTSNSKFQNQSVDIQLLPMFRLFAGKASYEFIELYDAYGKGNYFSGIISFTVNSWLISDSLCNKEIENQTSRINSGVETADAYLRRGEAYAGLKRFNEAFTDFAASEELDTVYPLVYYCRATTRYNLIQLINSLDNYDQQIMIRKNNSRVREQITSTELQHTYDAVVCDFESAINKDPGLFFAYYNRGIVYCQMGNYHKAVEDFTTAISLHRNFPEALFNRGLVQIMVGDAQSGCEDLSRAGELGISEAYKVMKRYCYK